MIKSLLTVAERRHFISLSPHALSPDWVTLLNQYRQTNAGRSFTWRAFCTLYVVEPSWRVSKLSGGQPIDLVGNGVLLPDGKLTIAESVNKITLMIGEYEEKVHPQSNQTERERVTRINATPKLRVRHLAKTDRRWAALWFYFLLRASSRGVIKDYALMANAIAAHNIQSDGL